MVQKLFLWFPNLTNSVSRTKKKDGSHYTLKAFIPIVYLYLENSYLYRIENLPLWNITHFAQWFSMKYRRENLLLNLYKITSNILEQSLFALSGTAFQFNISNFNHYFYTLHHLGHSSFYFIQWVITLLNFNP